MKYRKMLAIIFASILFIFLGIGLAGYLNGVLAPPFDPEKMTLNYELTGSGPKKMILIHGLTGSLNYWKKGIKDLSQSHTLLLVDILGFGDSPKPKGPYDLDMHISALEKVIEQEGFNSKETLVLGHSLGAILSLGLLARHPESFQGAALIGLPVYSGKDEIKQKFSRISLWDGISVDSRYKFVCFFHPLYMTHWFKPDNLTEDVFHDAGKHTWISYYHTLNEIILNTDWDHMAKDLRERRVLFIHGEKDEAAPIANAAQFAGFLDNSGFVSLKDADHQLFLQRPAQVWGFIDEFLNCTE